MSTYPKLSFHLNACRRLFFQPTYLSKKVLNKAFVTRRLRIYYAGKTCDN